MIKYFFILLTGGDYKMHKNILDDNNCALLIIDIQERFQPIIPDFNTLVENTIKLIKTAKMLNIPIIYTEQYPKGIGPTVKELIQYLDDASRFEKLTFSCCKEPSFKEHLKSLNKHQVIVCGIEAHICVNQTVHDLLAANYVPHLIQDAAFSRFPENKEIGINKMRSSGSVISCIEMCLFELMQHSKHPHFKEIQKLIV